MISPATPKTPPRDYAPLLRTLLGWLFTVLLLGGVAWWSWQQPFMERFRVGWELVRMPAPTALPVPVEGVSATTIADTWGGPRGTDRRHEGVDIFAPRGTPVRATTLGIVSSIRESGLGGRQVWVIGPARQRHYYAHLEGWAPGLSEGDVVRPGDVLGFVGDSGNARGTPTHLHYGIYGDTGAFNPWPLLREGASSAAKTTASEAAAE